MFSLRQTWNEVFPQSKLYALDIKINSIDPGWPITAQLKPKSPAIHVNPMFLKNKVGVLVPSVETGVRLVTFNVFDSIYRFPSQIWTCNSSFATSSASCWNYRPGSSSWN